MFAERGWSRSWRSAAVAAAALLAAGCSGSLDDAKPPATEATTSTTAAPGAGPLEPIAAGTYAADEYAEQLAKGLGQTLGVAVGEDWPGATGEQLRCVADTWVAAITPARFEEKGYVPEVLAAPTFPYATLGLDEATADGLAASIGACGIDVRALVRSSLQETLDPDQITCIDGKIDGGLERTLIRAAFIDAATADLQAQLAALAAECGIDVG